MWLVHADYSDKKLIFAGTTSSTDVLSAGCPSAQVPRCPSTKFQDPGPKTQDLSPRNYTQNSKLRFSHRDWQIALTIKFTTDVTMH